MIYDVKRLINASFQIQILNVSKILIFSVIIIIIVKIAGIPNIFSLYYKYEI